MAYYKGLDRCDPNEFYELIKADAYPICIEPGHDLDLCIFESDEPKFIAGLPLLQQTGYAIIGMPYGYKIYAKDGALVGKYPWTHPGCDIFIMLTDGKKAFYKHRFNRERTKGIEVELADILPLRRYTFGVLSVTGPRNPMPYLYSWYGEQCLEVAQRYYDHSTESVIEKKFKLLSGDDYEAALPHELLKHTIGAPNMPFWPTDFIAGYE